MKNKPVNLPLPLKLVKEFISLYPKSYQICDNFLGEKGIDLPIWDEHCVLPIAATLAIQSQYRLNPQKFYSEFPALLQALYSWRIYKEIYSFDEDMRSMLFEQADNIIVPIESLFALPYPCIYISCDIDKFKGFFCCFEQDMNNFGLEFRITLVSDDHCLPLWLHLKNGATIKDSIGLGILSSTQNILDGNTAKGLSEVGINALHKDAKDYELNNMYTLISQVLQLILYICADNSDTLENEEQKQYTRKPSVPHTPTDTFKEIRKWDVGFRIGNTIRKYKDVSTASSEGRSGDCHSTKRPHTRCGHWHHFWAGSEKGNSKKLILKWVAPMLINCDNEDDNAATEHKVK